MTASDNESGATRHRASVWVVPVLASAAEIQATLSLLRERRRMFSTIDVTGLRELLDIHRPEAAVVQGGAISTVLMDAQRWLFEFRVPTMVVVRDLTEYYEATLLDRGAQDVIGLPTSPRRLGSRLEVLIRDKQAPPPGAIPHVIPLGELAVDPETRSAVVGRQRLDLTRSEFDLLLVLTRRPGVVVTRRELSLALGHDQTGARALESHVSRLRTKLRRAGAPQVVETVRGVGYRFATTRADRIPDAPVPRPAPPPDAADSSSEPSLA